MSVPLPSIQISLSGKCSLSVISEDEINQTKKNYILEQVLVCVKYMYMPHFYFIFLSGKNG